MNNNEVGKFGITGNSGLGVLGYFHCGLPYDSNGMVFVSVGRCGDRWVRMPIDKAKIAITRRKRREIIKCYMCEKPAISLDHLWPYHSELCRCEEHYHKAIEE